MAFQSRFRETERHAFGERSGRGGDTASGEPSEVRTLSLNTYTIMTRTRAHTYTHTQPLAASDITRNVS